MSQAWQSLDASSATLPGQQPKHQAPEETVSGPFAAHLPYPATRGRPEAGKEKGGQQGSGSPAASWCFRSQLQETTPLLQPCSAPGPRARFSGSQGPRAEEQEQARARQLGRAGTVCPWRERPAEEARARRPGVADPAAFPRAGVLLASWLCGSEARAQGRAASGCPVTVSPGAPWLSVGSGRRRGWGNPAAAAC